MFQFHSVSQWSRSWFSVRRARVRCRFETFNCFFVVPSQFRIDGCQLSVRKELVTLLHYVEKSSNGWLHILSPKSNFLKNFGVRPYNTRKKCVKIWNLMNFINISINGLMLHLLAIHFAEEVWTKIKPSCIENLKKKILHVKKFSTFMTALSLWCDMRFLRCCVAFHTLVKETAESE